jgi:hypothetical protein
MNMPRRVLVLIIRLYQVTVSPLLTMAFGPSVRCRFTPSCSQYASLAVASHGVVKGGFLAARRLCRCHPWGDAGEDFPPAPGTFKFNLRGLKSWKRENCHGS